MKSSNSSLSNDALRLMTALAERHGLRGAVLVLMDADGAVSVVDTSASSPLADVDAICNVVSLIQHAIPRSMAGAANPELEALALKNATKATVQ